MIVSGRVSRKMAPVLRRIYDQMPEPKWVISMGACATSGGVFDNYAIVQGVDKIVPVDIYVPGCPPRPEMLVHAITMLQDKIMKESVKDRRDTFEPESRDLECARHAAGNRGNGTRTRNGSTRCDERERRGRIRCRRGTRATHVRKNLTADARVSEGDARYVSVTP